MVGALGAAWAPTPEILRSFLSGLTLAAHRATLGHSHEAHESDRRLVVVLAVHTSVLYISEFLEFSADHWQRSRTWLIHSDSGQCVCLNLVGSGTAAPVHVTFLLRTTELSNLRHVQHLFHAYRAAEKREADC